MLYHLYLIIREDGKKYVGVSKHPDIRLNQHLQGRGNKHLKGQKNLKMKILMSGERDLIFSMESFTIKDSEAELNIATGGYGGFSGNSKKGEDNHFSKLTESQVLEIRNLAYSNTKLSYKDIGQLFNISRETIGDICRGKTWKHIGGPIVENRTHKYDSEQIIVLYLNKISVEDIVEKLHISRSTVYNVLKRTKTKYHSISTNIKEKAIILRNTGKTYKEISQELKIGLTTAHRYCKQI